MSVKFVNKKYESLFFHIVVKQFWKLILGLIITIVTSLILFEYIQYAGILFTAGGLWVFLIC